jgi:hypothetical protein
MAAKKGSLESNKAEILRTNQVLFPPKSSKIVNKKGFGHQAGIKPRFETPEDLQKAINVYFATQEAAGNHPTVAGLSLSLGFKSRRTLMGYIDRDEDFAEVVETALTRMEDYKNQMLLKMEKGHHGVIFDLKNAHGWADRQEKVTTVEAGDTLADLLKSLQGNVLRPALEAHDDEIEEAEFEEIDEEGEPEPDPYKDVPNDVKGLF